MSESGISDIRGVAAVPVRVEYNKCVHAFAVRFANHHPRYLPRGSKTCKLLWCIRRKKGRFKMDSQVYKTIQITGASNVSSDDAVKIAVERASRTVHNLKWFK